jgi:hypothetical protein
MRFSFENRMTSDLPRETPNSAQMLVASCGWDRPENTSVSFRIGRLSCGQFGRSSGRSDAMRQVSFGSRSTGAEGGSEPEGPFELAPIESRRKRGAPAKFGKVEGVVEAAALGASQGRLDDELGDHGNVSKLNDVVVHVVIPEVLDDL